MEQHSSTVIRSERHFTINLVHRPEQRPAEFHPALNGSSLLTGDPVKDRPCGLPGGVRRRIFEHDKIKPRANFSVSSIGELVDRVEVIKMTRWQGWVSLQMR